MKTTHTTEEIEVLHWKDYYTMSSQSSSNQVVAEQHNQGTPCQQQERQYHQDAGLQIA